ncbi:MAG: S8 family peptidase [Chitinophagales bacterium]|nr:S8 family peptidase [Chitinophagales bacterium]
MRGLRFVLCGVIMMSAFLVNAQTPQYAYRIGFKDKQGAPDLSNPLSLFSQRALDRRNAQGISLDSTDRPVSPVYVNDIFTTISGKLHVTSRWLNQIVVLLTDTSNIAAVRSKPFVAYAEYVGYFGSGLYKQISEGDTGKMQKTTGSSAYYGTAYDQTKLVNGDYLHDRGYKGKGKLIAVMDEGFAGVNTGPVFDSLMKSGRLADTRNFVYNNNDVFTSFNHGTGCLSTIAGNIPGTYVGSAPEADIALYVTEYAYGDMPIEMDNMLAAAERADSVGADVISASVGYNTFSSPFKSLVYADIDGKTTVAAKAANMATKKGILFVITAGNEGGGGWNYVLTPGDADSAITIGGATLNRSAVSSSGNGPNAAGRVKPDVCMLGSNVSVMFTSTTPSYLGGTSYATPQLAGWAACLIQATSTNATPYRIRTAIIKSGHLYATPGPQMGYGVPDFGMAHNLLNVNDTPKEELTSVNWVMATPNPTKDVVTVRLLMQQTGNATISLIDASGRLVSKNQYNFNAGKQSIQLNMPASAGMYLLKVNANDKQKTIRLVKQ